jgi:hypothetical protein
VKETLAAWLTAAAGIETGPTFRYVCRAGKVWGTTSQKARLARCQETPMSMNIPCLVPHDLRRSSARPAMILGGESTTVSTRVSVTRFPPTVAGPLTTSTSLPRSTASGRFTGYPEVDFEPPEKSRFRKLQELLLNSPTVSILGKGPEDRPPHNQCEGRDHHHCAGLQGGNQVPSLSGASGLLL